jgi:TonB-dependent Receptor Plug Domain/Gram-negative bacterial TonB protein C-terminal
LKRLTSIVAAVLFAQSIGAAEAATPPQIEPPKPVDTPTPLAPAGTILAPSFVVDAVVTKEGVVTSAQVIEGDPTLAAMAEAAVLTWTFAPALRDGTPVAAKIRLRVELRLQPNPEPPPPPPSPPAWNATEPASPVAPGPPANPPTGPVKPVPAPAVEVEDVTVHGTRPLAPHVVILAAEIREMPGAFGDAFRAIEALPGVTPVLSGVPYFIIRGAPPGNTGFFLDGVRVPSLFHFAIGEAVVHPALVQSVDLYSGAYPAHFGRFAGGILSGDTVLPSDVFRGEAAVRVLDTGALLETPFAGGRGDALVSGRVGYPGLLLYAFDPSVGLQYYDYQARISYRFNDGSEIRVFGFGSYDELSTRTNGGPLQEILGIEFERGSVRYTRRVAKATELRVEAIVGHDRTATGTSPPVILTSESYSLSGQLIAHPSETTTVRTGADIVYEPYRFAFPFTGSSPGDPFGGALLGAYLPTAQNDLSMGLYGELGAVLSPRVDAELGVRGDLFTATYPGQPATPTTTARQVPAFDPRLTVKYKVTSPVTWISALGMAHQASNIPLPIPALSFSQLGRGLQTAYQFSEGIEAKLPWKFTATATTFLNDFAGLAQLSNDCPSGSSISCLATTVHGRSYGIELLVRRNLTQRLSGWLSYTFSRSERESFDGTTGLWGQRLSEFDRPHVANLVVAYDLGAHWRAGGRLVAYSGTPYATGSLDGTPNARTPPFFRLDLRVEKRWPKKWGHIALIAEWLNVLLQKETLGLTCDSAGTVACTPAVIGPITIPSLGLEVGF